MNYHIGRNGQPLGIFSEDQVRDGISRGTFLGTDLAWQEGMDDWKPLSSFSLFNVPPSLPPSVLSAPAIPPVTTPAASTNSGLAIASLICGIAAIPGFFCCLTPPLSLAAIICGHLALAEIAKNPQFENSRGQAKAGLIMGYILIALYIIMIVVQAGRGYMSAFRQ